MKKLLITFSLIFAGCATNNSKQANGTEDSNQLWETYCKSNDCRKDVHFKLNFDDGPVDQIIPYYFPVIQNQKVISVLAGEKLYIEADLIDNQLVNLKQVKSNSDPDRTIEISFNQIEDSQRMMLKVSNPFNKTLKFDIYMQALGDSESHYTSSCPAFANKSIIELWPYPIPELHILLREVLEGDKAEYTCD